MIVYRQYTIDIIYSVGTTKHYALLHYLIYFY